MVIDKKYIIKFYKRSDGRFKFMKFTNSWFVMKFYIIKYRIKYFATVKKCSVVDDARK